MSMPINDPMEEKRERDLFIKREMYKLKSKKMQSITVHFWNLLFYIN